LGSREVVETVFIELSLEVVDEDSALAKLRALAYGARLFLRGGLSARALTSWAWAWVEFDGPAVARDLGVLQYAFDLDDRHLWSLMIGTSGA